MSLKDRNVNFILMPAVNSGLDVFDVGATDSGAAELLIALGAARLRADVGPQLSLPWQSRCFFFSPFLTSA